MADDVEAVKSRVRTGIAESRKAQHHSTDIAEEARTIVNGDTASICTDIDNISRYVDGLSDPLEEAFKGYTASALNAARKANEAFQVLQDSPSGAAAGLPQAAAALVQTLEQYDPSLPIKVTFSDLRVGLTAARALVDAIAQAATAVSESAQAIAAQAQANAEQGDAYIAQS